MLLASTFLSSVPEISLEGADSIACAAHWIVFVEEMAEARSDVR